MAGGRRAANILAFVLRHLKSVLQNVEARAFETGPGDRAPDLPQQWNHFRDGVQIQSARLSFELSLSASTSNGFLISGTRLAPSGRHVTD